MNCKPFFHITHIFSLIISVTLLFSGCTHFNNLFRNPADVLNQSINTEWTAKVNKDWGTVYDLTTPPFKSKIKRDDFIKYANLDVISYEIKDITIDPDGKTATATISYTVFQMGFKIPMETTETWVKENGKWCVEMPPGIDFPFGNSK